MRVCPGKVNKLLHSAVPATVTTLAGVVSGHMDGTLTSALFNSPAGIAVDTAGILFVADSGSNCIRMISSGIWQSRVTCTLENAPD